MTIHTICSTIRRQTYKQRTSKSNFANPISPISIKRAYNDTSLCTFVLRREELTGKVKKYPDEGAGEYCSSTDNKNNSTGFVVSPPSSAGI